jgi:hypothetical protein
MLRRQLVLGCGLLSLTVLIIWPQALNMSAGVSDLGDSLLNSWTLAWVAHAVVADPTNLLNANIFYPEQRTSSRSPCSCRR